MIQDVLGKIGILMAGIWALTEIFKHYKPFNKIPTDLLALVVGVTLSSLLYVAGFFQSLPGETWWQNLLGIIVLALIGTAVSNKMHDWTVRPATKMAIKLITKDTQ